MKAYTFPNKLIRMVKIMCEDFECSVLEEEEQTRWLRSPLALNLNKDVSCQTSFSDWTMRRTTERHRNGIRWKFTSMFEDLDFADDIVLVSSKSVHIQNRTNRLVDNARKVGLQLNAQKCSVENEDTKRRQRNRIGREEVEDVEEFVYLGATVTNEGDGTEDIKERLSKTRGAYFNLRKIWNTRSIARNTKIKLHV